MKQIAFLIFALILATIMMITNPGKNEFLSWVKDDLVKKSETELEKGVASSLSTSYIDEFTKRQNYFVLSIYEVDNDIGLKDGKNNNYVGLFKFFIPIN